MSSDAVKEGYRKDIQDIETRYMDFNDYYEIVTSCINTMHQTGHLEILTPDKYQRELDREEAYKNEGDWKPGVEWRYQLYKDPQVRERYRYLEENEKTEMVGQNPAGGTGISRENLEFQELGEGDCICKN